MHFALFALTGERIEVATDATLFIRINDESALLSFIYYWIRCKHRERSEINCIINRRK